MFEKTPTAKRAVSITAVCSVLFTAGILSIIYTFTGAFAPYGVYYSAVNAIIMVIMFAALSGIWVMEKWGVYLFILLIIVKSGVDYLSGAFTFWLLLLLVPVVIFISQLKKMN